MPASLPHSHRNVVRGRFGVRHSTKADQREREEYPPPRLASLEAFRWAFAYFRIAFRCFLAAFSSNLRCCLAVFLSVSRDARAYSATPGLCAWAGTDGAMLTAPNRMKAAIRFIRNVSLVPQSAPVYAWLAPS